MIKKNIYSSFIKYLYESNLTQVQYRLVLYLLYNSDKSYKFITNNSFLIDTLGATKKTVIEAIKELLKKNIITKNNLQHGYELAVVFEKKKEVKEAPAEPTPAEVAPAESVTKVKKSRKKQHEETSAEPTPARAEEAPTEKPKRSRKPKKGKITKEK